MEQVRKFKVNDKINHKVFGPGKVIRVQERVQKIGEGTCPDSDIVVVTFDSGIQKEYFETVRNRWRGETRVLRKTNEYVFTDWSLQEALVPEDVMVDLEGEM